MTNEKIGSAQILHALRSSPRPVTNLKALLARLARSGRHAKRTRKLVLGLLRRLIEAGRVEQVVGGYRLVGRDGLREGVVETTADELQGAVIDDNRHRWAVRSATPLVKGRRVLFAPIEGSKSEAQVLDSIDETRQWVGVLRSGGRSAVVVPYQGRPHWRVAISPGDLAGAEDGEVVVAVPARSAGAKRRSHAGMQGRVVERCGRPGDPAADFRAVAWNHKLRIGFEPEVEMEVAALADALDPAELRRRVDLRARCFLTIDPESARDHDDALCIETRGDQLCLWVAIADVSHYVKAGTQLDHEALLRGNSVYFPDRVVPMLPERISADLCSLRAGRDRFVMAVEMRVDARGRVLRSSFYPAVIRSRAGLSYEQAAALMEPDSEQGRAADPEIVAQVRSLARLESRLRRLRFEGGSIDFDLSESRIELDTAGRPRRIVMCTRTRAHRAVEEAMLAANRAVSERLAKSAIGCIYRVHEVPNASDLESLRERLESFGLLDPRASAGLDSGQIHRALGRARGRPEAPLVNMLALRAMKQARYLPENRGHFALGFPSYLHFTSPIRRYADLVVHRGLADWLELGSGRHEGSPEMAAPLAAVAAQISFRERVAVAAERDMVSLKKCAFMSQFVGQPFNGIVSGVAPHGLYVTLDEHHVEGLVPSASLARDLSFDAPQQALISRRSGARYQLGDALRVEVEEVNPIRGWIRFAPLWVEKGAEKRTEKRSKTKAEKRPAARPGRAAKPASGRPLKKGRRPKRQARRKGAPTRGKGRR